MTPLELSVSDATIRSITYGHQLSARDVNLQKGVLDKISFSDMSISDEKKSYNLDPSGTV